MNQTLYSVVFFPFYHPYTYFSEEIQSFRPSSLEFYSQLEQNELVINNLPTQMFSHKQQQQSLQKLQNRLNQMPPKSPIRFPKRNKVLEKKRKQQKKYQEQFELSSPSIKQHKRKKYIQNPTRNVITNLGNQLLSLLGNKYKLNEILRRFHLKQSEDMISSLIIYIHAARKSQNSYLNIAKMQQIWYPSNVNYQLHQVLELFRKVSYFYLTHQPHLQVIKSPKMTRLAKLYHLKGIKSLINILRNPQITNKQQQH